MYILKICKKKGKTIEFSFQEKQQRDACTEEPLQKPLDTMQMWKHKEK